MSFAAYTARLREISARTGAPLPYLITSFAILHEATAIVPFVGIFFAARYHGMGQKAISMLASAAAEKSDDSWLVRKSSEWMIQGEQFAARLGRRYGLFGFEKGAPRDAQPALETRASQQIAGDVANVVVAYVAVKALIPARIALSLYWSPAFSRRVLQPLSRGVGRLLRR